VGGVARPREFDEDEVLDRALATFWEHGYTGTSIDDLVAATRLGRASLYGAFGDKAAIFDKALARYVEGLGDPAAAIDGERSPRAALERLMRSWLRGATPKGGPKGCFLQCTAVGGDAPPVARAREAYARYGARLERAILTLVERGQEQGELTRAAEAKAIARMLVVVSQGVAAGARAGLPTSQLAAAIETALALLSGA
jgi:AcrR family transcriptional regulator